MKIYWMLVLLNMVGVSSFGRLCRRIPLGDLCLEIAGSDGFDHDFPDYLVLGGAARSFAICGHHRTCLFWFHGDVRRRE
jgi:hypothetical protein